MGEQPDLPAPRYFQVPPQDDPAVFEGVVPRRALAYLVDLALIAFFGLLLALAALLLGIMSFGILSLPLATLLALWPAAYHTLTIGGPRSATPGMQLAGIAVRVWHGGKPGYLQALLHTVVFYVSVSLTFGLILLLPLFHNRGRCLHDILCGTFVVRVLPPR